MGGILGGAWYTQSEHMPRASIPYTQSEHMAYPERALNHKITIRLSIINSGWQKKLQDYIGYNENMSDKAYYEMVEHDGEMVRFYPGSGALMGERENGQLVIVGNNGGNPKFREPGYAQEMQKAATESRRQAVAQGLIEAGLELGLTGAGMPTAILTEIVKQRALVATRDNRDGNEAAKFIFSLDRQSQENDGQEENVIKFQLTEEQMADVVGKIFKED